MPAFDAVMPVYPAIRMKSDDFDTGTRTHAHLSHIQSFRVTHVAHGAQKSHQMGATVLVSILTMFVP